MVERKFQTYYMLVRTLAQCHSLTKLYKFDHPLVKERFAQVFKEMSKFISEKQSVVLSKTQDIFLVNGEQVDTDSGVIKRFIESFENLQLNSLEFEHNLTLDEFTIFMYLLAQAEKVRGEEQIRKYLKEKNVEHVTPLFAAYKLVREDEEVVKEGGVIKIGDLPAEVVQKFAEDLKKGAVAENLKKEKGTYKTLAHDAFFLSGLVFDNFKATNSPEELEKILWLVGDYLIDEIGSTKQEKMNSRLLEDLKDKLLKLCEAHEEKNMCQENVNTTFIKINSTLQIERLISLYEKNKKSAENVFKKLKDLMDTISQDSLLYKKAKERLEKIGLPRINEDLFKKTGQNGAQK